MLPGGVSGRGVYKITLLHANGKAFGVRFIVHNRSSAMSADMLARGKRIARALCCSLRSPPLGSHSTALVGQCLPEFPLCLGGFIVPNPLL